MSDETTTVEIRRVDKERLGALGSKNDTWPETLEKFTDLVEQRVDALDESVSGTERER